MISSGFDISHILNKSKTPFSDSNQHANRDILKIWYSVQKENWAPFLLRSDINRKIICD